MKYTDRYKPVGTIWKWYQDKWSEPGIHGLATPVFPVKINWYRPDADAFWGPSIHWNTHINRYVMLLNRAVGPPGYAQEGVYISYNASLSDPHGWSQPVKIYDGGWWYAQIIGLDESKHESDKLASRKARFFIYGESEWEILFLNPYEVE
jgi:hypothetical protein